MLFLASGFDLEQCKWLIKLCRGREGERSVLNKFTLLRYSLGSVRHVLKLLSNLSVLVLNNGLTEAINIAHFQCDLWKQELNYLNT